jgi:hypothetical protein
MSEQVITTPEVEEKTPTEPTEQKEQTIGEVLETKPEEPKEKPTIGLDKFLEIKKENKQLAKALKDLEAKLDTGATSEEISDDLNDLAEEFDVDKKFLSKLEKKIESRLESKFESKLKPLTEEKTIKRIDEAFKTHFTKALEEMPEYTNIVNPDVIKQLSLNPANSKKTFQQLIEETYGNALGGKRTIETSQPRGGKEPTEIDFERARKDTAYFNEVMSNPTLKAKYNSSIESRLNL